MNSESCNAVLGLGSNMFHPAIQIKQAIQQINKLRSCQVLKVSSFYLNPPVGPQFQPDFVNAVVILKTRLSPLLLLRKLQGIEHRHHRKRRKYWGPRTLDIDILLYKNKRLAHKKLVIPHPLMLQRAFVMWPLYEIAPEITMPNRDKIANLIKNISSNSLVLLPGITKVK